MRRVFPNLVLVACLLANVGIAGMWVRSYFRPDAHAVSYAWSTPAGRAEAAVTSFSDSGALRICWECTGLLPERQQKDGWDFSRWSSPGKGYPGFPPSALGFVYENSDELAKTWGGAGAQTRDWIAPFPAVWLVSLVPAILPVRAWRRRRRLRQRLGAGLCLVCGYDLRATPLRCPECGTVVAPRDEAGAAARPPAGGAA